MDDEAQAVLSLNHVPRRNVLDKRIKKVIRGSNNIFMFERRYEDCPSGHVRIRVQEEKASPYKQLFPDLHLSVERAGLVNLLFDAR